MVGRGQHRPFAHRARTMVAVEIAVLIGSGCVRALVRSHTGSTGEGRAVAIGRRREGPDRVTLASSVGGVDFRPAPLGQALSRGPVISRSRPIDPKIQKASLE